MKYACCRIHREQNLMRESQSYRFYLFSGLVHWDSVRC